MGGLTRFFKNQEPVAWLVAVLFILCVVFGGASRVHALRLAVVELSALPLLVMTARVWGSSDSWNEHRLAMGILVALAAIPLVQLVSLPPLIWTGLPGRDTIRMALSVAALPEGWLPITLTPDRTWQSFLALLPPAAMFAAVLSGSFRLGRLATFLLLLCTLASALLGLAQLASGGEALYPWETTDAGSVTGFFANRNHLATLCLVSLPFASVFAAASLRSPESGQHRLWMGLLYIVVIVGVIIAIRSRAGLIFLIPTLVLSFFAAWRASGRRSFHPGLLAAAAVITLSLGGMFGLAVNPIVDRFDRTLEAEGRFERWPGIATAAEEYLPVGSGVGSFDAVYRSVEPLAQLGPRYFNQAHNDYLELWLETGWLGAALFVAFVIWFGRRCVVAWRGGPMTDNDLQRASSVGVLIILMHSIADYPLRTVTITVVFALCCGLLELTSQPVPAIRSRRTKTRRSAQLAGSGLG